MQSIQIKKALLSVSNKTGLVEFAQELISLGISIVSTGGTSQLLQKSDIPHQKVESITGMGEMFSGRIKTLHPHIHGAILGLRDQHAEEAATHKIDWIDLIVVNFYPFETLPETADWDEIVELIDIGGPTMVRAAAKNFAWTGVVTDPNDYERCLSELRGGSLSLQTRKEFSAKAFALTSHYDAIIHQYFLRKMDEVNSNIVNLQLEKVSSLRYGENPHQKADVFRLQNEKGILDAKQLQGKPLSYNNIFDAETSLFCVHEFEQPACVIVKHANPCGVAIGNDSLEAYERAYAADSVSAFGGIVALNRPCDQAVAEKLSQCFYEVIIAPHFSEEAIAFFSKKPALRLLQLDQIKQQVWEYKSVSGGFLRQERDIHTLDLTHLTFVTERKSNEDECNALLFAWKVVKYLKSNAIVIANEYQTFGVGAGQVSRIDAVDIALRKAGEQAKFGVLASDAFFPFRDSIDHIAKSGVRAIIQPGGSVRDHEVIAACNEHDIAMAFTGTRCFRH